jgi:hypothetical protein
MTTQESNTLIALFMGYKFYKGCFLDGGGDRYNANIDLWVKEPTPEFLTIKGGKHHLVDDGDCGSYCEDYFMDGNAKYDEDWNWLMPVVEKIGQLKYQVDLTQGATSSCGIRKLGIKHSFEGNLLENTYTAVVAFIEWYNKNEYGKETQNRIL